MKQLVAEFGRKFALAIIAMALGFVLAIVGLVVVVWRPAAANEAAQIVGQFAVVLSVSIGAFSGANAVVEWRYGQAAPDGARRPDAGPGPVSAATRRSGTVVEPALGDG